MAELRETYSPSEFLRPIATGWLGKIAQAKTAKKDFNEVASQCMEFYSGSMGFMWGSKFSQKYMGGDLKPRFKLTIAKAFELVAIVGPSLYWQNPQVRVMPRRARDYDPQALQTYLQFDQDLAAVYQMAQQDDARDRAEQTLRAQLVETMLNYYPGEMPDGGLAAHSERAITECLLKGRGTLWTEPYVMPGSQTTLIGSHYKSVDKLLIDPDAESMAFDECYWIALECTEPVWEAERRYQLPAGTLKGKGTTESGNSMGERLGDDLHQLRRAEGKTQDLITYYKIWSRAGVGARLTGIDGRLKDELDETVGDFAYIVVAPDVPFPLNAPPELFDSADDQEVEEAFRWPAPTYKDNRWPCAVLDFYDNPGKPWPIATLAPGLGELTFINLMFSAMCGRIWNSSRTLVAILESAWEEVSKPLKSGDDLCLFKLKDMHQGVDNVVSFLEQPEIKNDVYKMLDAGFDLFERRTGLSELLYGLNPGGTQSRSAEETATKREFVNIRTDHMAAKVEAWQRQRAQLERFHLRWFAEAEDVAPCLGPFGGVLWERLVTSQDPELVIREMDCTIEAGSARRPNKQREIENINAVMHVIAPELSKHADITGDTGPLNAFFEKWADVMDEDLEGMQMGPRTPPPPPPPPPEMQAAQEMQMQAEQQKAQSGLMKIGAEIEAKKADVMIKREAAQQKTEQHRQEMQQDQQKHELELEQTWQNHFARMQQQADEAANQQANALRRFQQQGAAANGAGAR